VNNYRATVQKIDEIVRGDQAGELVRGRLRNQADFYSLVGAIHGLSQLGHVIDAEMARGHLRAFVAAVENEQTRAQFAPAQSYFSASRAASNDAGPRQTRINTVKEILIGNLAVPQV
jgi:hypothetical protein